MRFPSLPSLAIYPEHPLNAPAASPRAARGGDDSMLQLHLDEEPARSRCALRLSLIGEIMPS